jgi:hypothetical protein
MTYYHWSCRSFELGQTLTGPATRNEDGRWSTPEVIESAVQRKLYDRGLVYALKWAEDPLILADDWHLRVPSRERYCYRVDPSEDVRVITRTCGCWIAARARRTFLTEPT